LSFRSFKFATFLKLNCYQTKAQTKLMIDIRIIAASETYPLRHKILRQNEPIEKCVYPFDTAASTVHFGLFESNALIGIISVFETKKEVFSDQKQFQIRGMAVLENHQKKGYGAALVQHAMTYLQKEQEFLIWFNARIIALGFYEKLGFQKIGTEFEIVPIGMHYIMFKRF
jgi:ribosomal protein S18 acetylase RimI-like enzyme